MNTYEEIEKRFQEDFRKELRLAGEELIRRSENMNLSGFDIMTDCTITIKLPINFHGDAKVPEIDFSISCCNRKRCDHIMGEVE